MQPVEPHDKLLQRLNELGWNVTKNDFRNGQFVLSAEGPGGQKADRVGSTIEMATASLITHATQVQNMRQPTSHDINYQWNFSIDESWVESPVNIHASSDGDYLDIAHQLRIARSLDSSFSELSDTQQRSLLANALYASVLDKNDFKVLKYTDKSLSVKELHNVLLHENTSNMSLIIAKINSNLDMIRYAALEDIRSYNGEGFHFRQAIARLIESPLSLKMASTAWFLMHPFSSDLAIINSKTAKLFNCESDGMDRYHELERLLRVAKNTTGYSHLSLGLYSFGVANNDPLSREDGLNLDIQQEYTWVNKKIASGRSYLPNFDNIQPLLAQASKEYHTESVPESYKLSTEFVTPIRTADSLSKKEKKLADKLSKKDIRQDEDARVYGYFAAVQVNVSPKQLKEFFKSQDEKYEDKYTSNWDKFKKKALKSCERWHKNQPVGL